MKKTFLTGCVAAALLFTGNVNAQTYAEVEKPSDGTPWSIEVSSGNFINGLNWGDASLRGRYFLNDNLALRLQVGIGDGSGAAMSEEKRYYEFGDGTGGEGTEKINRSAMNFQIGAEYHFIGTRKLDPYAALGINFGFGGEKSVGTEFDGVSYNPAVSYEGSGKYSVVGATLGLGMDFYFVENVYVGLEAGLGFHALSYTDEEFSQTVTVGGVSSTSNSITPGRKESHLGTHAVVRLGWRF